MSIFGHAVVLVAVGCPSRIVEFKKGNIYMHVWRSRGKSGPETELRVVSERGLTETRGVGGMRRKERLRQNPENDL